MNRRDFIKTASIMAAYMTIPSSYLAMAGQKEEKLKGHADIVEMKSDNVFVGKTFFIERPIVLDGNDVIRFHRCTFVIHDRLYLSDVNVFIVKPTCDNKEFNECLFHSFSSHLGRAMSPDKSQGAMFYLEPRSGHSHVS